MTVLYVLFLAILKSLAKRPPTIIPEDTPTAWKSIYIVTLVAILGALTTHCIMPMVYPYMTKLLPQTNEQTYSYLISMSNACGAASSIIAGILSNRFGTTTGALIFSKILATIAGIVYFLIGTFNSGRIVAFFIAIGCFGLSSGAANQYKTHIAMASREVDRPKAMGWAALASSFGVILGPLLQLVFTKIGYPGWDFIFGSKLNLYTVPVLITLIISILGAILLVCCFDGKMRIRRKDAMPMENISTVSASVKGSQEMLTDHVEDEPSQSRIKFDKLAAVICILAYIVLSSVSLVISTILPPYMIMIYEWTSDESVSKLSIIMPIVGVCILLVNSGYIFCNFGKRITPRIGIISGMLCFFIYFLVTFPWSFLSEHIPYSHPTHSQENTTLQNSTSNATVENVGCPFAYKWCATTPRINIIIFYASTILMFGVGFPIVGISLDILFSKILGPIRQGTMQGVYNGAGVAFQILGPILLGKIYTLTGPRYIWAFMIALTIVCILMLLIFYTRMISYKKRVERLHNQRVTIEFRRTDNKFFTFLKNHVPCLKNV